MKLSKELLGDALFHAYREETGDDKYSFYKAMSAFENDALEIEGYVREDHFADDSKMVSWTKFDPNDPRTHPPKTGNYLVYFPFTGRIEEATYKSVHCDFDTIYEISHWRPLPKPPVETEETR